MSRLQLPPFIFTKIVKSNMFCLKYLVIINLNCFYSFLTFKSMENYYQSLNHTIFTIPSIIFLSSYLQMRIKYSLPADLNLHIKSN